VTTALKGTKKLIEEENVMSREEIVAKLVEFAAMSFKKDASGINENTNISEELGVASSQRVAMTASIEDEFEVMIPVARFGKFETIGDLADYIEEEM
jgi:acyl carrier protein